MVFLAKAPFNFLNSNSIVVLSIMNNSNLELKVLL